MQTKINLAFADYSRLIRRMGKDPRLSSTHISLCAALFAAWQKSGYANPFGITRKQLMVYSRIASVATYHKCIRELDEHGYIRYQPSFNPKTGSLVYWLDQVQSKSQA
ncbi:hypothetical protein [Mucilaginibacter sp.]|uniref:hypothetical protein n=1 Tax=Mucilaginibacter sp. TaxID=1882438 RepID=UPI00284D4484|nr:hypothetical protein [Mucilaginibacter sp.]MDR3697716.1 hypothetical protein [Mucilaginibacter sp.]